MAALALRASYLRLKPPAGAILGVSDEGSCVQIALQEEHNEEGSVRDCVCRWGNMQLHAGRGPPAPEARATFVFTCRQPRTARVIPRNEFNVFPASRENGKFHPRG